MVAHVRQALQQTAAIGACSPYLPAACTIRPCQTVFIATDLYGATPSPASLAARRKRSSSVIITTVGVLEGEGRRQLDGVV